MNKSLLVAALVALAITACGKKEEAAAPAAEAMAPAAAPVVEAAPAAPAPEAASAPAAMPAEPMKK
jgi:predicted small lipoprotein YifL